MERRSEETMTLTLDPATAEATAADAQAYAADLEARLKDGDVKVTAKALAEARQKAEYAVLRAQGAKAQAVREAAEELARQGEELHARFTEDMLDAFETIEGKIVGFAASAGALLDVVGTYEQRRDGFKRQWNTLFAGNTELSAAVKFKAGHSSSGDFGALGQSNQVARKVSPVQLVIAVLSEAITSAGFSPGELDGIDRDLRGQLTSTGYANGLRSIRQLRKQLDKETEE